MGEMNSSNQNNNRKLTINEGTKAITALIQRLLFLNKRPDSPKIHPSTHPMIKS